MKTNPSTKAPPKPLILNSTDEKIISMMFTFRFGGALDTAHYLFSPNSLSYARSRLSSLAAAKYLYRFRLPSAKTGGTGSKQTDLRLVEMRLCYELARKPTTVEILREGTKEKLKVIPDAWLCFEVLKDGLHERFIPVLLEI